VNTEPREFLRQGTGREGLNPHRIEGRTEPLKVRGDPALPDTLRQNGKMKGIIYIGSTGPGSGRSLLGWLLAESLLHKGISTGFVKFVPDQKGERELPREDPDSILFGRLLGEGKTRTLFPPKEDGATSGGLPVLSLDEVCEQLRGWGKGWECLLLMGSQRAFSDPPLFPFSEIDLVRRIRADVFLLDRYEAEATSIYSLLSIQSLLRDLTRCLIINRIPSMEFDRERARMKPLLERQEVTSVAFIPERSILSSLTIGEIARRLPAEIVAGEALPERRISRCSLGMSLLQGPLRIFRQSYGRIVLLGEKPPGTSNAGRSPEESVAGILLPGQRLPNSHMIHAARKANVSLLASSRDAFGTMETLNDILGAIRWEDRLKQEIFSQLLLKDLGLRDILECVPLRE